MALGQTIPTLLAQTPVNPGEGLTYELEPAWSWAPAVVVLLIAVVVPLVIGLVLFLYLSERGGAGVFPRVGLAVVRLLLIGIVVLMLVGWMLNQNRTDLPDVVVLLDDSASMAFEDLYDDEDLRDALAKRVKSVGLDESTRMNLAKTLLLENDAKLLDSLSDGYNLKFYRISSSPRAEGEEQGSLAESILSAPADQSESRLGKCLRDVLEFQRGRPTAAVVAFTDGVTTDGKTMGEVADYARRKAIPLYLVGLGVDRPPRDVRLGDLLVDEVVFVNDIVNFDVKLTASGFEGEALNIKLRQTKDGPVVAEETVTLVKDGETVSVRLSHRPEEIGDFEYVVEADELPAEATTENNRLSRLVSVRDEKIRVLLAQEAPSHEFRFLSTLLGRQLRGDEKDGDKSIELTTVLQEADERFAQADDSVRRIFPLRRDELFEYDVIIFGDLNPASFGQLVMDYLVEFVKKRGGGLVFIAGPRHTPLSYRETPLAELMPIDLNTCTVPDPALPLTNQFKVRPTRLGRASPQFQLGDSLGENSQVWGNLEGLYWLVDAPDVKPGVRVLAEHPTLRGSGGQNLPVISMHYVGAGKVIFHATDETYRWRYRVGDKYFARYWIQTIRYLSRSKLLGDNKAAVLTADRDVYRRGETVGLRVKFFDDRLAPPEDDGVTLVMERSEGQRRHMKLRRESTARGVFEGAMTGLGEGQYNVWIATPTLEGNPPSVKFAVVAPPGEQARLEMDSRDLQRAAKTSGGHFYTIDNAGKLSKDLPKGRQVQIASLPPISIWGIWYVALTFAGIFVLLIVTEWILRKRAGML